MAKAKPTPDSQWDDEPGFNPDTGEYVRLDTDAWLRDHGIRDEARERGERNFPPADAGDLDDIHYKIQAWVNHRGRQCQGDVSQHLSDLIVQLNDIEKDEDLAILENQVAAIANNADISLDQRVRQDRMGLTRLETAVSQGTRAYEDFRRQARLHRLPDYSGRRNAVLVIMLCALAEVVLNASLLMEVNPFGLVGGVMQMGLITAVNILVGALAMGFALRCRNLVSAIRRAAAWLVIVALVPLIGAFNLLVGHFRDSMQAALGDAAINPFAMLEDDAWPRMLADPLGFDSLKTSLLVLLGMLFFGIAAWKGYQSDDPYPGYGRRDRQLNAIKDNYHRTSDKAHTGIKDVYEQYTTKLEDIRHRLEIKKGKWKDLCDRGARIVCLYPTNLRQYQNDLNFLISAYRTENQRVRTEPSPRFFNDRLEIDEAILVPPSFEPPPETRSEGVEECIHAAIIKVQTAYRSAYQQYRSLEDITAEGFARDEPA